MPVEHLPALDGDAEIHDLGPAALVDEDVRRLGMEVDDAQVVDMVQRRGDLQDHVIECHPAVTIEVLRDLLPGEELRREVGEALVEQPVLANLDDALRAERGQRGELGLEPQKLLRLRQFVPEDLDGLVTSSAISETSIDAGRSGFFQNRASLVARGKLQRGS